MGKGRPHSERRSSRVRRTGIGPGVCRGRIMPWRRPGKFVCRGGIESARKRPAGGRFHFAGCDRNAAAFGGSDCGAIALSPADGYPDISRYPGQHIDIVV